MFSQADLHISSMESALLLGTTFSDLNFFFTVSLPFVPLARERLRELHSFGTWSVGVLSDMCRSRCFVSGCVSKGVVVFFFLKSDLQLLGHFFHIDYVSAWLG